MKELKWEELKQTPVGTILHDEFDEGIRFIVMRGPASLCAYAGIPKDHPLAGHDYESLPVSAHGGLTFASEGSDKWPTGFYWYGWDYAHCLDYSFYNNEFPSLSKDAHSRDKKWLVKDVINDSWEALYDLKKLMRLAENIRNKTT